MIPGQRHRWYPPAKRREQELELERRADRLLTNDRRRSRRQARRIDKPVTESAAMPRRYTLADLPELRRRGLLP